MKIIQDENNFCKNLRDWIVGNAPNEKYKDCFWMKYMSYDEYKKLTRSFPAISLGFVTDMNIQPTSVSAFLKKLAMKAPTNQEKAYLWYKYLVKCCSINLNDLALTPTVDDKPKQKPSIVTPSTEPSPPKHNTVPSEFKNTRNTCYAPIEQK